jgi:hypothetical protein
VRQLHPSTNLILAVLGGLGLLGSLTMPWFAAPVEDTTATDGPIERAAFQISHMFGTSPKGPVNGSDALGGSSMVLVVLVALIALLALAVSTPAIRRQAEDTLRVVAFALPVAVLIVSLAHSGTETPVHVHYGTFVGFAIALFTASAAYQGASMREQRKKPARPGFGTTR